MTELKKVDEIKDLGVLFHPELSFVSHCKEKINRAYSMLGIIKRNFIYLTEEWRCICYIAYCVQKKNIHFFCLQNISATSLILLIFAVGGHCVVDHNLNTQVSNATAISFSIIHFNPLKLYPLSENIFRKWFASYFLFIHEHLIIIWSPIVKLIAIMTLLLMSGLHRCQQRNHFYAVRISISLAILSEIFIQIGYFF